MSSNNKSDNNKPRTRVEQFLPEVNRSETTTTFMEGSINRHLTKDNTSHVSGYIGYTNPGALPQHVRRLNEVDPHIDAFQIEPVVVTNIGTETTTLTQQSFLKKLELLGVDVASMSRWGKVDQFNWAPPINMDMLINYSNYYWKTKTTSSTPAPQYFTIESVCNKAQSRVDSYKSIIEFRGAELHVQDMDFVAQQFVVSGQFDDVFTNGLKFNMANTVHGNFLGRVWTVVESEFDGDNTIITVEEDIALVSETEPTTSKVGRWWYKPSTHELFGWNGVSDWIPTTSLVSIDISLRYQLAIYERIAGCACAQQGGWDVGAWDDNPPSDPLWNQSLQEMITHPTAADWIAANGTPSLGDRWYNLLTDELFVWSADAEWKLIEVGFSAKLSNITGGEAWDSTVGCVAQIDTPWATQNQWMHKTQITSPTGIVRAAVPILEYNSNVELTNWVQTDYTWKYRISVDKPFEPVEVKPSRLELEPIKQFKAVQQLDGWIFYLYGVDQRAPQNINYSDTFEIGGTIRVTDNTHLSYVSTVKSVVYRQSNTSDPIEVRDGSYITVVEIEEIDYYGPTEGGGPQLARIEPVKTSLGDPWRGYHVHWVVDISTVSTHPAPAQPRSYVGESDTEIGPLATVAGTLTVGDWYQIFQNNAATDLVELHARLTYNPSIPSKLYAIAGGSQLRVYINGVRQIGNYQEVTAQVPIDYVVIGNTVYHQDDGIAPVYNYVTAVQFDYNIAPFSEIRIEIGPSARSDINYSLVPVRTIEDEAEFAAAVAVQAQPVLTSIHDYELVEQEKRLVNQYPMFNIYDVITGEVVGSNPIITYDESPDSPVNAATQRRIKVSDGGRDFTFRQWLVGSNNELMAYKMYEDTPYYWYNPNTSKVAYWDGESYTDLIQLSVHGDRYMSQIVVADTEPTVLNNTMAALWYYPTDNIIRYRDTLNSVWSVMLTDPIVVSNVDPTLRTIWSQGTTDETYTPQFVNRDKEPVAVGTVDADWETLDPWFFNPQHDNNELVNYTQLVTHFNSILAEQPAVPALPGGGVYSYTQSDINYGLGGYIKEHNDNYDLLVSVVNNSDVSPITVMDFARDQYENSLLAVTQNVMTAFEGIITSSSYEAEQQLIAAVINKVILNIEQNDLLTKLFGDSPSYDAATGRGIKNWVATPPMFGLSSPVKPSITVDLDGTYRLVHHDGHRSAVTVPPSLVDDVSRDIVSIGASVGYSSTQQPPSTYTELETLFEGVSGDDLLGKVWYTTPYATRQLYQLQGVKISNTPPVITVDTPVGAKYYNLVAQRTYVNIGGSWQVTGDPVGDISAMWQPINFGSIIAATILEIENRLYEVCEGLALRDLAFTSDLDIATVYQEKLSDRFSVYSLNNGLVAPLSNANFNNQDPFTWNYGVSSIVLPPRLDKLPTPFASWQALYEYWFNTPYPHLEPWKLQGYVTKPEWWDEEYLNTEPNVYGTRKWKYDHTTLTGMWFNIKNGIIPSGRTPPTGMVPTYGYVPVNIANIPTSAIGGYASDELLPPYFNNVVADTGPEVRSLFATLVAEVVAQDTDFVLGTMGPAEWDWVNSIQYRYDQLIAAFQVEPLKFLHSTFGPTFVTIDGLQVEVDTKKVYSHRDIKFHGNARDESSNIRVLGLNQWYVNYNRYVGVDTGGPFSTAWREWTPKLGYQTSGIIDTSTFSVTSKYFEITDQDYDILLSKDGFVTDLWVDAFNISVLNIPPSIIQYNNESKWKFSVNALAPIAREVSIYDVEQYPVRYEVGSDVFSVCEYVIQQSDTINNAIIVEHDVTAAFVRNHTIVIEGSGANDGTYTIVSAAYSPQQNTTRVTLSESLTDNSVGIVSTERSNLPWSTGDGVVITSTTSVPRPFASNVVYYVIPVDDHRFKLAETFSDAENGLAVVVDWEGKGLLQIGRVASTFNVYGGSGASTDTWIHYAINRQSSKQVQLPITISGMQQLINFVDGFEAFSTEFGIQYGKGEYSEYDPNTGRLVNWQSEVERFIDWAHRLRRSSLTVSDRYEVVVADTATDEFEFSSTSPGWPLGTSIVFTTTGSLPTNVYSTREYFVIPTSSGRFKLSQYNPVGTTTPVDLIDSGSGTLFASLPVKRQVFPTFEMSPIRNQFLISTPLGQLSSVIQEGQGDIRIKPTIFDQYGRPMTSDKLLVFRQDTETRIAAIENLYNDVEPQIPGLESSYNHLHVGGAHLFLDAYQHIVVFDNYTTGGAYIYDPFVGLAVRRFNIDCYETTNYTLRPTLGGYFLIGSDFVRNIEGSISDIQTYYSAYDQVSQTDASRYAKRLLDYSGNLNFLDLLGVTPAAQFTFYRGMLQTKGSMESVAAYINSRRFVDAKIDEFWAQKLAEYGDARKKRYPEISLQINDGELDDVQLIFAATPTDGDSQEVIDMVDKGFEFVETNSPTRYHRLPEQDTSLFLNVDVVDAVKVYFGVEEPTSERQTSLVGMWWVDPTSGDIKEYDVETNSWTASSTTTVLTSIVDDITRVRFDTPADTVRLVVKIPRVAGNLDVYEPLTLQDADSGSFTIINSNVVEVSHFDLPTSEETSTGAVYTWYAIAPSVSSNSAPKLIDSKVGVAVTNIPTWDPARGHHSHVAQHNVDVIGLDPAVYGTTLTPRTSEMVWNKPEVGTMWVDGSRLGYLPYYDAVHYPNVRDKIRKWGKLAEWASVNAYEWVESTVPPEEWDDKASSGKSLPNGVTPSGIAKPSQFKKTRDHISGASTVNVEGPKIVIELSSSPGMGGATGLQSSNQYVVVIEYGAEAKTIAVTGSLVGNTYNTLINYLNVQLTDIATVTLQGNELVIQSTSMIDLFTKSNDDLFVHLTQYADARLDAGVSGTLKVPGDHFTLEDSIILVDGPDLAGVEYGVEYGISNITSNSTHQFITLLDNSLNVTATIGSEVTDITCCKAFSSMVWERDLFINERVYPAMIFSGTQTNGPELQLDAALGWKSGDLVDIYVNGSLTTDVGLEVSDLLTVQLDIGVNASDVIEVVKNVATVDESDDIDDGSKLVTYKDFYEYTTTTQFIKGQEVNYYYFWVQYTTWRDVNKRDVLSASEIAQQMVDNPEPFVIYHMPKDDPILSTFVDENNVEATLPIHYRSVVLRNLSQYIQEDDRYIIQFTDDNTLRYMPDTSRGHMDLKDRHFEWLMFRKSQIGTINRDLWDRVIESIVGHELKNPTIKVPSLARVLYDDMYGTDTRYGLASGQQFVDGQLAMNTIRKFLTDPDNDFYPIDVDLFNDRHPMVTPSDIIAGLTELYETFGSDNVNKLWFEILADALTTKAQHRELMKTSWIALHGIRILDVAGLFDD